MLASAPQELTSYRLATFMSRLREKDIPEAVMNRAALSTLDTIASLIGGVPTTNARHMREGARAFFGDGGSRIWFTGACAHPAAAILGNCAAASALDIDDGHRGASGHPGAAIIPAVLHEAIRTQRDGRDVLAAIAIGYDVALRIASSRLPGTVKTYSSGRWTGYGVAAAIAWLRGMPTSQMVHAMTIAGGESPENLPAGSYRRLSSIKGSSPWSTLTALVAVDRAAAGAEGPEDSLDRRDVYGSAAITSDLGRRWLIEETYLKPYAACRYTHPSIDAVLRIMQRRPIAPEGIRALRVEVFPEAFTITNERVPQTLESAQFSIPFCLALATLRGVSVFRPMTEDALRDRAVLDLSSRVEMVVGADFVGAFPQRTPSRVIIEAAGVVLEETVDHPAGDVANPLRDDDIERKLLDLARDVCAPELVDDTLRGCRDLIEGRTTLLTMLESS